MFHKSEVKSATGIPERRRKKSTVPDNLYVFNATCSIDEFAKMFVEL